MRADSLHPMPVLTNESSPIPVRTRIGTPPPQHIQSELGMPAINPVPDGPPSDVAGPVSLPDRIGTCGLDWPPDASAQPQVPPRPQTVRAVARRAMNPPNDCL